MIKKLINTPYSFDIESIIEKKKIFEEKYSNSTIFVFVKNEESNFFPHMVSCDSVSIKGKELKRNFSDLISETPFKTSQEIKLGNVYIFDKVENYFHHYTKNVKSSLLNKIFNSFDEAGKKIPEDDFSSNQAEVEFIIDFCQSSQICADPFYFKIEKLLNDSLHKLESTRDLIYLWNIGNLISHLQCIDGESGTFLCMLLD